MPDLTKRQPLHPGWVEPRFDADDVTPDPFASALANYMAIEREIAEARMAMARDVSSLIDNAFAQQGRG